MHKQSQIQNYFEEEFERTCLKKHLLIYSANSSYTEQFEVQIPYNSQTRQLDLGYVLHSIFTNVLEIQGPIQIFYYHSKFQYYVYAGIYPFQDKLQLGEQFIPQNVITVLFKGLPSAPGLPLLDQKKKRVKDRTIKEALEKVAEWRTLHEQHIPKLTLQQAAKIVNIPKKTLDDYYFHIKIGQKYGFDFQGHLENKTGILRKFVKENHKKKLNMEQVKILQKYIDYKDQEQ